MSFGLDVPGFHKGDGERGYGSDGMGIAQEPSHEGSGAECQVDLEGARQHVSGEDQGRLATSSVVRERKYPTGVVGAVVGKLIASDCIEAMKAMEPKSVDSVVCDPPAGISFMGKDWDHDKGGRDKWIEWMESVARECLRVVKPGAHALVWALPRTSHWTAMAWENAGWEVRERIAHIFGTGFPKSLAIDKALDVAEKRRWLDVCKDIDNLDSSFILAAWKELLDIVSDADLLSPRNEIVTGMSMPRNDSVPVNVMLCINPENSLASVIVAELNSSGVRRIVGASLPFVPSDAERSTMVLSIPVINAARSSESREARQSTGTFIVPLNVAGWQRESTMDNLKAVEALKTWLGRSKSSSKADTIALCAALTDDLKRIILNQSETFRRSDMIQQMECVSAINVTITESTAASLISFTVATLRSKAIDKAAGAEREIVGRRIGRAATLQQDMRGGRYIGGKSGVIDCSAITAPATSEAKKWNGYGTALKPSVEDWWLLRRPLVGTIAENVLRHGTGAINVDGCRVLTGDNLNGGAYSGGVRPTSAMGLTGEAGGTSSVLEAGTERLSPDDFKQPEGRWPANLVLTHHPNCGDSCVDGCPIRELGEQSGELHARGNVTPTKRRHSDGVFEAHGCSFGVGPDGPIDRGDNEAAARFFPCFRYQAKASGSERSLGLTPVGGGDGVEHRNLHPT